MKKIIFTIFLILTIIFLMHVTVVKSAVWGDGRYYYSYLHSLYFNHDLKFNNEYQYFKITEYITPTGYLANKFSFGVPLLWFPFFITADITTRILNIFGANLPADGYSLPYQIVVGLGNIIYALIGLVCLYKSLLIFFGRRISSLSIFCILFATNLLFYTAVDPITSHAVSFFAVSTFLYYYLNTKNKLNTSRSVILGLLFGVLISIRFQDFLFLILLISSLKKFYKHITTFILGLSLGFLPQTIVWKILYGSPFTSPYFWGGREHFNFLKPQIIGVLLNYENGFFLWTPITIFCVLGLFFFVKYKLILGWPFILIFLSNLYLISSWSGWNQGASYSIRMLISILPILSFGLAEILNIFLKRISFIAMILVCLLFIILNLVTIYYFLLIN